MSDADRSRWNARWSASPPDFAPAEWVVARAALLAPRHAGATALDLACGNGRHALYLARLGYAVDAWDVSDVALEQLRARLDEDPAKVTPRHVDLDTTTLPSGAWKLAQQVCDVVSQRGSRPLCTMYTYSPDDGKNAEKKDGVVRTVDVPPAIKVAS